MGSNDNDFNRQEYNHYIPCYSSRLRRLGIYLRRKETMTEQDRRRLTHLLTLADLAQDMPTVYLKLSNFWDALREDMGLAKLLLAIKEHVQQGEADGISSNIIS